MRTLRTLLDNESGEDITASILTQVVLQARNGADRLLTQVLTGLIRAGGDTIAIVGIDAIARHMWVSESETDGKATSTKIGVLQVWQKQDGAWKLLARQSVRPPQAQSS